MREKKYHISSSGFLSPCEAFQRGCPRGGEHYSVEAYETMVKQGDVRVPLSSNPKAGSTLAKAEEVYKEASKEYYSPEVQRFRQDEMRKRKIDTASIKKAAEESHNRYQKVSNFTRRFLEKNGVQYWDVMQVARSMEHSPVFDPTKDRYDKDLNKVMDKLVADPKFIQLRDKAVAARESKNNTEALHVAVEERFARDDAAQKLQAAGSELQKAKRWASARIPDAAKEMHVDSITQEMVSHDKNGNINNVWVSERAGIRRVANLQGHKLDDLRTGFIGVDGKPIYPSKELIVGPKTEA